MKKILTASAIAACTIIASTSPGSAMGSAPVWELRAAASGQPQIIKVHNRGRAREVLYDYGYRNVYFLRTRGRYDDRPTYVFRASKGYRDYHVLVDWYGNIVSRHRADRCYRRSY